MDQDALPRWIPNRSRTRRGPSLLGSRGPGSLYRRAKSLELLLTRDRAAALQFLNARYPVDFGMLERAAMLRRFVQTTDAVRCWHTQAEILAVVHAIFLRAGSPGPSVVEAGTGKGASTAKLSLAAARAGGTLVAFDSFRGLPQNDERHTRLDGSPVVFFGGAFPGRLPTVQRTVERWGDASVCELRKGWFEETLPGFDRPIDVALLDVDLLSSTRTCLVHLFPKVRPGGVVFSQDGHLQAIVELLRSERFWCDEVRVPPPRIEGLGERKMLALYPRG